MSEQHRSFFASSIATALSQFCQVDSADVKAKLLGKSKIKLKEVLLIPKIIRSNVDHEIEVTGRIEVVDFQYKMNVIKGSKSVRKARLDVKGVHICLGVKTKNSRQDATELSHALGTSSNVGDTKYTSWKQKFVKNIIDQIAIHIQDLTVSLSIPHEYDCNHGRQIVVLANDVELIAFKREKLKTKSLWKKKKDKSSPLIQKLEIGSLSSHLKDMDDQGIYTAQSIPFVEPFRYSCSLKRFHGERFSGMKSGLEVIGDMNIPSLQLPLVHSISNDGQSDDDDDDIPMFSSIEDLKVCTDQDEIEIQFSPQKMSSIMLSKEEPAFNESFVERQDMSTTPCHVKIHLGTSQSNALFRAISYFRGSPNHSSGMPEAKRRHVFPSSFRRTSKERNMAISLISSSSSDNDPFYSSVYCLPFPSLEIQLPNKAVIYLSKCEWQYRTDGSVHKFEGNGGAVFNNVAILDDEGKWFIDFSRRNIVIRPSRQRELNKYHPKDYSIHEHGADLNLNFIELRQLADGLGSVLNLRNKKDTQPGSKSHQKSWEIHVEGNTKLTL